MAAGQNDEKQKMNDENHDEDDIVVKGIVKWFDPVKGFGFVVTQDNDRDVLLHANVLRNFGQSSVADSAEIEIVVQETDRGIQAIEILSIIPPISNGSEHDEESAFYLDVDTDAGDFEPARVKWFDKTKGFGFVNIFGNSEDVFVHVEILLRSGLSDLQPGEAIAIKAVDGERGRMASIVTAWDSIARDRS